MKLKISRQQQAAILLFAAILIYLACSQLCPILSRQRIEFLNDRSAEIINALPLSALDLLNSGRLTGKGQIIGIADSGLDKGSLSDIHPDLQSESGKMPRVAMLKSYSDRELPDDPVGHGTHMAATIAGSGAASDGQYSGVAPGASIYFQALLDSNNQLQVPDSIETLFLPAYQAGVRTHVNGWGRTGNYYAGISAQIDKFVYNHPDFLPLFGAGNSGPGTASLTSEANSKNALTIGSSQVPRPALSPDAGFADQVSSSSSLGPAGDGRIKPELLAPGSAVVSACSSLIDSNYAANDSYTLMGGSSMATAVTGGAVALLKEYLKTDMKIDAPSAALVKALLVNGARLEDSMPSTAQGFGILDLAGTVLALEEKTFMLQDNASLQQGEIQQFSVVVSNSNQPFKATLAWSDPAAASGSSSALVNNLDLIVEGPGGTVYHGNDFLSRGQADTINNIEQVYIPSPHPGTYIVKVRGSNLGQGYSLQKYALVYGQALKQATINSLDEKQITLDDSQSIEWQEIQVKRFVLDGQKASAEHIKSGSQLYLAANGAAYIFSSSWASSSVQMVSTSEGKLIMEANSQKREGGFYLDSRGGADSQILVNGETWTETDSFPAGAELTARVNPVYQTLWQLSAAYQEVSGYIAGYNYDSGKLTLIHQEDSYLLTKWAAVNLSNKLVNCSVQDYPYGYGETADLKDLMPGMKVTLMLSPGSNLVNYIKVERELVLGVAADIDTQSETIQLNTGFIYNVFPGTLIKRDGRNVGLDELQAGDHIAGLLLPGSSNLLQIEVSSTIKYGKVIYFNSRDNSLYFMDNQNRVDQYRIDEDTGLFRRGSLADRSMLVPGCWIRLICPSDDDLVCRIDIAEVDKEEEMKFAVYYPGTQTIEMTDGTQYYYTGATLLSKNGYCLQPEDLLSGEKVKVTTLAAGASDRVSLAALEAVYSKGVVSPTLQLNLNSLNGALIVQGESNADRVVLYREDNSRQAIQVDPGGHFSAVYKLLDGESRIQALAINTQTGGIYGLERDIQAFPVIAGSISFYDIQNHPARSQIEELAGRGVVRGYEDGTYKPDRAISRVELIKILALSQEWTPSGRGGIFFNDYQDIPWWALGAVSAAVEQGVVKGYTDGTLRPQAEVSWAEMVLIMERVYRPDYLSIRVRTAISRGYQQGLMGTGNAPVTRAQAAAFIIWMETQL